MEQSWFVSAAKMTLYFFYGLVGASLVGIALGRILGRSYVASGGLLRVLVEYVGNTDFESDGARAWDRRRNPEARVLMERIREEMIRRAVPSQDVERVVEELRATVRAEGRKTAF